MMLRHHFAHFLLRLFPLLLSLACAQVLAQSDPPGRVGRLNHTEGAVTFSPAGDNEWIDAELNRPLTRGDRLWTDKGSRAEIQIGSASLRMDGHTQLEVLALNDQSSQLSVTQGTVYVRVRSLPEGENFEIDTPNLAYRASYPGDYRIDVDAARGTTRVTIHSGTGAVYGEAGQALPLGGGQQVTFRARSLAQVGAQESPPQDNFDRWAAERNRREDQSVSARYVPREVVGYQQLDAHGQWSQDPTHGPVWIPQGTVANWAPYRHGRWEWIGPWGWTWIDDAPWGFAPSHYGRWTMINSRWAWVPGRLGLRPVYAPALVAFIGGGASNSAWSIPIAAGRPGVAWFPLAPGEAWQPGYRASPVYLGNVNRNMTPPQANASFAHQSRPEALTAISTEDFHRGRPVRGSWLRVAANTLTKAQIVPPPPMPEGGTLVTRERPATARAAPPPQLDVRQVAVKPEAMEQGAQRLRMDQAKAAEQARSAEQARATEQLKQAKAAELAKQAQQAQQSQANEQARIAEQTRKEAQQARASEQARVAEQFRQARATEQSRAAERSKADQAKAAEQASQAQQDRLAASRKIAEQARLAQQAKAASQAQANARAQRNRAEQARLAQQARAAEVAAQQNRRLEQARLAQQARAEAASQRNQATRAAQPRKGVTPAQLAAAKREAAANREQAAKAEQSKRMALAAAQARREALAREEKIRRDTHAQHVEQARRAADRDAEVLRMQREQARSRAADREAEVVRVQREQVRRDAQEREAWERSQQAQVEQWRRDQQAWEQQQRERTRQRPDLRPDLRNDRRAPAPEVWQRGIPILNPGRTS